MTRPDRSEYAEYYDRYASLVPDGDIAELLERQLPVTSSNAGARPLAALLDEWAAVRAATVALVRSLDAELLARAGTASGVRFTVRSFPWIIAGHELHHRRLLRERYGLGGADGA